MKVFEKIKKIFLPDSRVLNIRATSRLLVYSPGNFSSCQLKVTWSSST